MTYLVCPYLGFFLKQKILRVMAPVLKNSQVNSCAFCPLNICSFISEMRWWVLLGVCAHEGEAPQHSSERLWESRPDGWRTRSFTDALWSMLMRGRRWTASKRRANVLPLQIALLLSPALPGLFNLILCAPHELPGLLSACICCTPTLALTNMTQRFHGQHMLAGQLSADY